MKLSYYEDSTSKYWYAATDRGGYDAAGKNVEQALASLVRELERALDEGEEEE